MVCQQKLPPRRVDDEVLKFEFVNRPIRSESENSPKDRESFSLKEPVLIFYL